MPLDFDELRARGEAADLLYNIARYDEAVTAYEAIYDDMRRAGPVDMFVSAKIALGLLLTWIESGQVERAFRLWTSSPRDDLGEGIYALEHGQTALHDWMAYLVVSAFFHSLSAEDVNAASEAVNIHMQRVVDYAREHDLEMLPVVLKDWKQFLIQLHGTVVPYPHGDAVVREMERWGKPIPLDGVDFPPPTGWARPGGN